MTDLRSVNGIPLTPEQEDLLSRLKALEDEIKRIEDRIISVGDASQLAEFELEIVRQDYQRAVATISNLIKGLYDTTLAVIQKLEK